MLEIIWLLKYLAMATHKLLIYLATFQSHHVTIFWVIMPHVPQTRYDTITKYLPK